MSSRHAPDSQTSLFEAAIDIRTPSDIPPTSPAVLVDADAPVSGRCFCFRTHSEGSCWMHSAPHPGAMAFAHWRDSGKMANDLAACTCYRESLERAITHNQHTARQYTKRWNVPFTLDADGAIRPLEGWTPRPEIHVGAQIEGREILQVAVYAHPYHTDDRPSWWPAERRGASAMQPDRYRVLHLPPATIYLALADGPREPTEP